MASIKKLKKTIQFVSSELITNVYIRSLASAKADTNKLEALSIEIMNINNEFILRSNRPDGKDNPKLVKQYYKKLFADWNLAMDKIIKDIENL